MHLIAGRFGPYFVEPVVAGLDEHGNPFVASCDLIGCPMVTSDFVVSGTASDQLSGMCEALWRPDMARCSSSRGLADCIQSPEDLFEAISQSLLNAVDRDAYSGWGGIVHIMYVRFPVLMQPCHTMQRERQDHHQNTEGPYGLVASRYLLLRSQRQTSCKGTVGWWRRWWFGVQDHET
jgi:20S proteasome alpha/beta subunit